MIHTDTNNTTAAEKFRALHQASAMFVMPCAWDAFSAILFERAGFCCVGTTSGGVNWVRGHMDYVYETTRDVMLSAYRDIAQSTQLPVSGDLENGYGESPEAVADTISASIVHGMVGGSIEDQNVVPTDATCSNGKLYEIEHAVERIQAAKEAGDKGGRPYTLTARCEVYYTQSSDPYREAVRRSNAYREAGADCLFVPGLNDLRELKQLVRDVDGPISFGMGASATPINLSLLEDVGVRRVSTGGSLARATFGLIDAANREILANGTFSYLTDAMTEAQVNEVLSLPNQ